MYSSDLLARNMHKLIRTKQKIVGELTYAGESTAAPRGGQIRKLSTAATACHDRENGLQINKFVNNKLAEIKEKYSNKAFAWEGYMNYTDHLN
jgi:hypothetical protein